MPVSLRYLLLRSRPWYPRTKARILPLGFEIAALRSNPDVPWTLSDIVNGFDSCQRNDRGAVIPSSNQQHRFCIELVDHSQLHVLQ